MKFSYIISALEAFAPRALQESWDNSGLQIAPPPGCDECTGVMLCLDVSEDIIDEAVANGCNLIVSHHPLIFKGLKSLTGRTRPEILTARALRAGVAVYSAHTSLDSTVGGISHAMAARLGAKVRRPLVPSAMHMERISVICAREDAEDVRLILLDKIDDHILSAPVEGNDLKITTNSDGIPSITPLHTALTRVEADVPAMHSTEVCNALSLFSGHAPLRISVERLADSVNGYGLGVVADFDEAVDMRRLADMIREQFGLSKLRASRAANANVKVRRIALCGGSGGEFIRDAISSGATAYITGDVRYHDFCDYGNELAIFDIGHFEGEICAKDIFYGVLSEKFPNFAVYYSQSEQNPVIYL